MEAFDAALAKGALPTLAQADGQLDALAASERTARQVSGGILLALGAASIGAGIGVAIGGSTNQRQIDALVESLLGP